MTPHTFNRREFVAISATAAASAAISSTTLAGSTSTASPPNLPRPTLARVIPDPANPTTAGLRPVSASGIGTRPTLANPSITITPIKGIEDRLDQNASITIEAHHPIPNLYAILYSAHNCGLGAFPSAMRINAPQNARGQTTLRISQHINGSTKAHLITLNTSIPGEYILAIPTAPRSGNPNWRFTRAQLDQAGQITALTNPVPAFSSRCAYFSITITEQNTGA